MDEGSPHSHWVDGQIVDGSPRPAGSAWAWLATVAVLVLAVDLVLGFSQPDIATQPQRATEAIETSEIRTRLLSANEAADAGDPAWVLVGDSVLAGDAMAPSVADWRSQRVVDHMRAELGVDSPARFEQIAFDGLLPIDALHVLVELDRIDPGAKVGFVLELDLRYFSSHYAEQFDCTRASVCELGRTQLGGVVARSNPVLDVARSNQLSRTFESGTLARAILGLGESAGLARDWLQRRVPVARHRGQLRQPELSAMSGLAVARPDPSPSAVDGVERPAAEPVARAEGFARVQAHYRSSSIEPDHAQVAALEQIVVRLRARGRSAALFLTPLEDEFVRATLPGNRLGKREAQLTALIHARGLDAPGSSARPAIELLDLDHPLFGSEYFLDHVHLEPEGNRLLALNLLHELGLPLRERPWEWMMVHNEDHDRSLVHRRGVGFADGGALDALFRAPEGVATSRTGDWIVVADSGNHMLRQLRGSMQIVERLAGQPKQAGRRDGPASLAHLQNPRSPEIVGDTVYFIDGSEAERVRAVAGDMVETLAWSGPSCARYLELEAADDRLYLLCADDRVLAIEIGARTATQLFGSKRSVASEGPVGLRGLEPTDDGRLLLADADSRIWSLALEPGHTQPEPKLVFANAGPELLPRAFKSTYPFSFAEMGVNRIVGMEWVERYDALLIQDEHDLGRGTDRLHREETERIHLRLLDLDHELIYPWIKAIPHAEAFHMWNEVTQNLVSYYHLGAMAVAQADASLIYVEHHRSRLFRISDGLQAVAKAGSLHTKWSKIVLLQPINTNTANEISATMRPDRYLGVRHEPIPRTGPYVALLVGSSLSTISDRFCNYSLARWLELELQAELGYRDGIRLDLYQRIHPAASLKADGNAFNDFLTAEGPPPDIVLFELHDFEQKYFRDTKTRKARLAQLGRIERLARRYQTLVIFYDNSTTVASARDGLRATSPEIHELIADIRKIGFLVLEPSDRLLRELLVESPWGNQPWGQGLHHGSPWAIELTAKAFASIAYPEIREFLRGRVPARLREQDPTSFDERVGRSGLAGAFEPTAGLVDRDALPVVRGSFVQHEYEDRKLELFVDLAGATEFPRTTAGYEALALSVLYAELETEVYGQLAEKVSIELLEFQNYDEYGEGVREAAAVIWDARLDKAKLEKLIRRVAAEQGSK